MHLWRDLGLDMEAHRLVTLVGAGGKTTLMYGLAHEARQEGRTVIVSTTTHILPHPRLFLMDEPDRAALRRYGVVVAGHCDRNGKLTGPDEPGRLLQEADVVVIEGDGAKMLPLKAPEDWEPVIPRETRAVVAMAGADAIGHEIAAVCHRSCRVAELLDKPLDGIVTAADVARILAHPQGGRKGVKPEMAFRCAINKADTTPRLTAATEVADLLEHKGIYAVVTSFEEEERGGLCWF